MSTKAVDVVDIEDIVKRYAIGIFETQRTNDPTEVPREHLVYVVDWKGVRFFHHEPNFVDKQKPHAPKSQILYKTHFTNNTELEQEFTLKADRTTTSVCEVSVERALTVGCEMNLSFKTPDDIFATNAGFKREVSITNPQGETVVEQTMTWGVDGLIKVPPMCKTSAVLVISEDSFASSFTVRTDVSGMVMVSALNSQDNNTMRYAVEHDVVDIIRRRKSEHFTIDDSLGVATYITKGRCSFRYGIEQDVQLSQQKLG